MVRDRYGTGCVYAKSSTRMIRSTGCDDTEYGIDDTEYGIDDTEYGIDDTNNQSINMNSPICCKSNPRS